MTLSLAWTRRTRRSGFTLIEILIVIAIVGILAALAFPAYTAHIASARRADARTQLMQAAQFMQRFYAANDRYDQDRVTPTANSVRTRIPNNLRQSPADGTKMYDLIVQAATPSAYELRMVPAGGMASDTCGAYTLTSTGVRGVWLGGALDGNSWAGGAAGSTALRNSCWK